MKTGFFAVTAIAFLLLIIAGFSVGDSLRAKAVNPQFTRLVSLLPDSDAVAVFDAKRCLDDPLPTLLSANQPILNKVMAKIAEMEINTGIDFRQFEQVAVGVAMKQPTENKEVGFEPVAIASGDINEGSLIAVAKLASKGKYREEEIGGRTVYVFMVKDAMKAPAKHTKNLKTAHPNTHIPAEIALTALDGKTLALGCPDRVRQTIEATSHVGEDITGLLSTKETAVMSFALKTSGGMSKLGLFGMGKLGAKIDSIEYLSGSMDVDPAGTSLQLMARTTRPNQALKLIDTLQTRQLIAINLLGRSNRADQQVYGRMVENSEFDLRGNDVTLDLLVPQADIDVLMTDIK